MVKCIGGIAQLVCDYCPISEVYKTSQINNYVVFVFDLCDRVVCICGPAGGESTVPSFFLSSW